MNFDPEAMMCVTEEQRQALYRHRLMGQAEKSLQCHTDVPCGACITCLNAKLDVETAIAKANSDKRIELEAEVERLKHWIETSEFEEHQRAMRAADNYTEMKKARDTANARAEKAEAEVLELTHKVGDTRFVSDLIKSDNQILYKALVEVMEFLPNARDVLARTGHPGLKQYADRLLTEFRKYNKYEHYSQET